MSTTLPQIVMCIVVMNAESTPSAERGVLVEMQVVQVSAQRSPLRAPGRGVKTTAGGFLFEAFEQVELRDVLDAVRAAPDASVLTAPRLMTNDGQQASISIGEHAHYLVADADGCLRLAETEAFVEGLLIEVTPTIGDSGTIELRFDRIRLSRMIGRETLEDVPLDVGRPVVRTIETSATLELAGHTAAAIQLPTDAAEDGVVTLYVTATIVDLEDRAEDGAAPTE